MLDKLKSTFRFGFITLLLIAFAYAIFNYQSLIDQWRLYNYDPPQEIVKLADNTTMNDQTRRLFYANQPLINDKDTFRQNCNNHEHTIVLGCYVSNRGIYLLQVKDDRLDGIKEVTAAHEVLHAAYDRLSSSERDSVDKMTASMIKNITDDRILETVEQYRKKDSHSVDNELHSILGTEVRSLSQELEDYYAKYFDDRSAIVDYSEDYQDEFESREDRAEMLLEQINDIEAEISRLDADIDARRDELDRRREQLETNRSEQSAAEFNQNAETYNAQVQEFNETLRYRNSLAREYNQVREEYNALVVEEKELIRAIDSREQSL